MVVLSLEAYSRLTDGIEAALDMADKAAEEDVYTAMKRLARGTLSAEDKEIVEVTDDEKVDMEDIYKILKYVARKITML